MMYTYSIMPLLESGFDEIVEDIKEQCARGVSIMPLFKFAPVPEGTPVWDKIGPMCALYENTVMHFQNPALNQAFWRMHREMPASAKIAARKQFLIGM